MTEGSKSGPSEVKRYTLRYVPNHEPEQRMYDRDGMWAPSKSEFVLASDYDSLRTQLSAIEAKNAELSRLLNEQTNTALFAMTERDRMSEALKLARPYVEIVFARNPQQQLPGIALAAIDAALASESSAT